MAWDVHHVLLAQARRLSALVRILVRFTKPTQVDHIRTKNSSQYAKYDHLPVRSATQASLPSAMWACSANGPRDSESCSLCLWPRTMACCHKSVDLAQARSLVESLERRSRCLGSWLRRAATRSKQRRRVRPGSGGNGISKRLVALISPAIMIRKCGGRVRHGYTRDFQTCADSHGNGHACASSTFQAVLSTPPDGLGTRLTNYKAVQFSTVMYMYLINKHATACR